jgi:hypothetical protein
MDLPKSVARKRGVTKNDPREEVVSMSG